MSPQGSEASVSSKPSTAGDYGSPPDGKLEVPIWRHATNSRVADARNTQRQADQCYLKSQQAHDETWLDNERHYAKVHAELQKKLAQTRHLQQQLTGRIKSVEASISLSKHSCADLQEASIGKKAALQLVSARLDLRHRARPDGELKRDALEVALNEQKETLLASQKRLGHYARKTDNMITELGHIHEALLQDLQSKTQSLHVDLDCVQTSASMGAVTVHAPCEGAGNPELHRSAVSMYASMPEQQEHRRQLDAVARMRFAKKREEAAHALRDESTQITRQAHIACTSADDRTNTAMQNNINELQSNLARLKEAGRAQEERIKSIVEILSRTGESMQDHEKPSALNSTRLNLRKQRHTVENIRDPVRAALDSQAKSLKSNFEALAARHGEEKDMLTELQKMHTKLREDIADKGRALDTDLKCRDVLRIEDQPAYQSGKHSTRMKERTMGSFGTDIMHMKTGTNKATAHAIMNLKIGASGRAHSLPRNNCCYDEASAKQ